jgi:arylsulfatase A-like enzyme
MAALAQTGQRDNTIVVVTSDHGENMGSHHLWNKISVNEEALRVPMIVAHAGTLAPRVVDDQVASLVDVAPTLLGTLGIDPPAFMQGADLLAGGRPQREGAAFAENLCGELAIRTPTHTYAVLTRTAEGGPERELVDDAFLFTDLREDPYQMTNLAETGEQAALGRELRERILAWDRATPWLAGSRGGVYGQGPQHDPPPPASGYRVGG